MTTSERLLFTLLFAVMVVGCNREPTAKRASSDSAVPAPTNRVDINQQVRQNLGITFAKVESRSVANTLRVPGRFELTPTARREYRVPAAGSVELLVEQYQSVEAGTPLYRLDSPRWRELQRELTDAESAVAFANASADSIGPLMRASEQHHSAVAAAVTLWSARVKMLEELQEAGGASGNDVAQAQAALVSAQVGLAEAAETHTQHTVRERESKAQLEAARSRQTILFEAAASLTGKTVPELLELVNGTERWLSIDQVEVRALSSGVVDKFDVSSGTFVDQHSAVLATVQPDQVRFVAHALQSDLGRLSTGLRATAVAPRGGSLDDSERVTGMLTLAPTADADRRTIELVMTPDSDSGRASWARSGVAGFLEVVVDGTEAPELAIPLACVVRDGTQSIIFRRDPADPDKAIRMEADLGMDDGRWIVIKSGVAEGNEIVLDGVYQLMVATSGSITKGGHFHPDGTFHEGED